MLTRSTADLAQRVLLKAPKTGVGVEDRLLLVGRSCCKIASSHIGHSVARTCNLIFIVLDVLKPLNDKKIIETELEGFGIRLNKKPPNITVKKKEKGGLSPVV
jgi:hypothetical protein